jgi:hypothetical protein
MSPTRTKQLLSTLVLSTFALLALGSDDDGGGDGVGAACTPGDVTYTTSSSNGCVSTLTPSGGTDLSTCKVSGNYTIAGTGTAGATGTYSITPSNPGGASRSTRSFAVGAAGSWDDSQSFNCSAVGCADASSYEVTIAPDAGFSCDDFEVTSLEVPVTP